MVIMMFNQKWDWFFKIIYIHFDWLLQFYVKVTLVNTIFKVKSMISYDKFLS